jgi:hypothetical protein
MRYSRADKRGIQAEPRIQTQSANLPTQVYSLLATIMAMDVDLALNEEDMEAEQSKTELDFHANVEGNGILATQVSN